MSPVEPYLVIGLCDGLCALAFKIALRVHQQQTTHAAIMRGALSSVSFLGLRRVLTLVPLGIVVLAASVRLLAGKVNSTDVSWEDAHFSTRGQDLMFGLGGDYRNCWVQGAEYIRHTYKPGTSIAYSEMGYGAYENLSMRFIDTRGLTNRAIAHAGNAVHEITGVTNNEAYSPDDAYWTIILASKPDFILIYKIPAIHRNYSTIVSVPGYHFRKITFTDFSLQEFRHFGSIR